MDINMGMDVNDELTRGHIHQTCIAYCSSQGYYYAGTQWGSECWCGAGDSAYDTYGPGTCDYPCSGDDSQTCGGDYSMNVYPSKRLLRSCTIPYRTACVLPCSCLI